MGLGYRIRSLSIKGVMNAASRLLLLWTCWRLPAGCFDARWTPAAVAVQISDLLLESRPAA